METMGPGPWAQVTVRLRMGAGGGPAARAQPGSLVPPGSGVPQCPSGTLRFDSMAPPEPSLPPKFCFGPSLLHPEAVGR